MSRRSIPYSTKMIGCQMLDRWTARQTPPISFHGCVLERPFLIQSSKDSSIPRHFTLLTAVQCWVIQKCTAVTIPWWSFEVFIPWLWSQSLLGVALMVYREWFSFKIYSFKCTKTMNHNTNNITAEGWGFYIFLNILHPILFLFLIRARYTT